MGYLLDTRNKDKRHKYVNDDNFDIRYSLSKVSVNRNAFMVDEQTGVVYPRGNPVSLFYSMVIVATDRGQPARSTHAYLCLSETGS